MRLEKRRYVIIKPHRIKESNFGEIPSADEFLARLKSKYNQDIDGQSPKPFAEHNILNDWLEEKGKKPIAGKEQVKRVDAALGLNNSEMDVRTLFSKYFDQGLYSYQKGDYRGSIQYFGKALKINPHHHEALRLLLKAFYFVKHQNRKTVQ